MTENTLPLKAGDVYVTQHMDITRTKLVEDHWLCREVIAEGPVVDLIATYETPGEWNFTPTGDPVKVWDREEALSGVVYP